VDLKSLQRRCLLRVRELTIPRPFNLPELCANVAAKRDRDIRLLPMTLPGCGPCGLWIAGQHEDYIVYQQSTSRLHQEHIVLHEVGHLLCQHPGAARLGDEHIRLVFPHLDPEKVRAVLARAMYPNDEEREAEMLASLILHQAQRRPIPARTTDPAGAAIVARLEASMNLTGPG
jgi:hypothetical protein